MKNNMRRMTVRFVRGYNKPKPRTRHDFKLVNAGSIFLLTPLSKAAKLWADAHLPDECTMWGEAVVVEHRYIEPIVCGIVTDGMTVS
jgi:hypothetical protein